METKIINTFLTLLIVLSFVFFLIKNLNFYQQKFNPVELSQIYSQSQFAQKPENRKLIIQRILLLDLSIMVISCVITNGNV